MIALIVRTMAHHQQTKHCINSLISDALENGICYFADYFYLTVNSMTILSPLQAVLFVMKGLLKSEENNAQLWNCSSETELLLSKSECVREVFEQPAFILNTIQKLIYFSCSFKTNAIYNFGEAIGYPPASPFDPDYMYPDNFDYYPGNLNHYSDGVMNA